MKKCLENAYENVM